MGQAMELETRDTQAPVTLADECFGVAFHEALVHQAVATYAQRGRQGTSAQKNRSAVRGGGSKPWRQKGTGRARAGSIRSPIWRGGGLAHPATGRVYEVKLNKKMYRHAMRSIFSELLRQERLHVVESFDLPEPKTRLAREKLESLGLTRTLVLVEHMEPNVFLAMRNLPNYDACEVSAVDPVSLLRYEHVVVTRLALDLLERRLGGTSS